MKRKFVICLTAVLSAVLLFGCSHDPAQEPVSPESEAESTESQSMTVESEAPGTDSVPDSLPESTADTAEPEKSPLGERLAGKYRKAGEGSEDEGETFLELYWINGILIAEITQTHAAYLAQELFPTDEDGLYSTSSDAVQAEAYTFSGFSGMGAYWEQTETYTLHLTDDGIDFVSSDGITDHYLRDDSLEPQHPTEPYREPLGIGDDTVFSDAYAGEWTGRTEGGGEVFLRLGEDGTVLCLYKQPGEPICVHTGLRSAADENGNVSCMTERIGWGNMPWFDTVSLSADNDGQLAVKTGEPCGFLPAGETFILTGAD